MGWGTEPHEGWADQKYPDGRWNDGTTRGGDPDPVATQAACSCGWRSDREHPLPPRPENMPRNDNGIPYGPEWEGWTTELGRLEDLCWEEWRVEHFDPMLGYEPHTQLILGRSDGGQRHFLDGRPVHAGAGLELFMPDGSWLPIRYEWSFSEQHPPRAYAAIGMPKAAEKIQDPSLIGFDLPPDAILRWPAT